MYMGAERARASWEEEDGKAQENEVGLRPRRRAARSADGGLVQSVKRAQRPLLRREREQGTHILLLLLLLLLLAVPGRLVELRRRLVVARDAPERVERLCEPGLLRLHRPDALLHLLPSLLLPHGDACRADVAERVDAALAPAGEHARELAVLLVARRLVARAAAGALRLLRFGCGSRCGRGLERRLEAGLLLLLRRGRCRRGRRWRGGKGGEGVVGAEARRLGLDRLLLLLLGLLLSVHHLLLPQVVVVRLLLLVLRLHRLLLLLVHELLLLLLCACTMSRTKVSEGALERRRRASRRRKGRT